MNSRNFLALFVCMFTIFKPVNAFRHLNKNLCFSSSSFQNFTDGKSHKGNKQNHSCGSLPQIKFIAEIEREW